jgi:hypothetical protein
MENYRYTDDTKTSIYFGLYPQTLVVDEALIERLNRLIGPLPTKNNYYTWERYGYFSHGIIVEYAFFMDIQIKGEIYRGAYFTMYRDGTTESADGFKGIQEYNGYKTNIVYWFKFEPIKWNILKIENNKALIVSDKILDAQNFNYTVDTKELAIDYQNNVMRGIVKSNNYKYSSIRFWLNVRFYRWAFDKNERKIIDETNVDNSIRSVKDKLNVYICDDTKDKIFLPSVRDLYTYFRPIEKRLINGTDYSKCQGLSVEENFKGNCFWTRSPKGVDGMPLINFINHDGHRHTCSAFYTDIGVLPMCWINL